MQKILWAAGSPQQTEEIVIFWLKKEVWLYHQRTTQNQCEKKRRSEPHKNDLKVAHNLREKRDYSDLWIFALILKNSCCMLQVRKKCSWHVSPSLDERATRWSHSLLRIWLIWVQISAVICWWEESCPHKTFASVTPYAPPRNTGHNAKYLYKYLQQCLQ